MSTVMEVQKNKRFSFHVFKKINTKWEQINICCIFTRVIFPENKDKGIHPLNLLIIGIGVVYDIRVIFSCLLNCLQ